MSNPKTRQAGKAAESAGGLPLAAVHLVRDSCLCLHVHRTARALARQFDDVLRPLGLTNGQFSLLTALNRPQPPSLGSVAALLAMDRTTLTANLKPLARRGLLKVAVDSQDRRSRRLIITASGRALLVKAYPLWERAHAETERRVTACTPGALRQALRALSCPPQAAGRETGPVDKPAF